MEQDLFELSDSQLHDLVLDHPDAAHIKDAQNCKYLACNKNFSDVFGVLGPDELIGITLNSLEKKYMDGVWDESYVQNVNKLDYKVRSSGRVASINNDISLDAYNHVRFQQMIKYPLRGKNNKVTSILTITYDLTKKSDLFYLWGLYKSMHEDIASAAKYFVSSLGVKDGIAKQVSGEKEVVALLNLIKNQSNRYPVDNNNGDCVDFMF